MKIITVFVWYFSNGFSRDRNFSKCAIFNWIVRQRYVKTLLFNGDFSIFLIRLEVSDFLYTCSRLWRLSQYLCGIFQMVFLETGIFQKVQFSIELSVRALCQNAPFQWRFFDISNQLRGFRFFVNILKIMKIITVFVWYFSNGFSRDRNFSKSAIFNWIQLSALC